MKKTTGFLTTALLILIAVTSAFAAGPQMINYQGYLTDSSGNPVGAQTPASVQMTFRIYDSIDSAAAALWAETQSVQVSNGVYNVELGSQESLSLPFDEQYWIGFTIGSDAEMVPRQKLMHVPYAITSGNSEKLGGLPASDFAEATHTHDSVVPEPQIDPAITRDNEIMPRLLSSDGAASGLDADLLDGLHASAFSVTSHAHTETDPTVPASVKDGVSWSELSGIPAGFADGTDNTGLTSESDPKIGTLSTNYIPKWNGSFLMTGSIYDSGNIGIGTTTPSSKLDVNGDINTINGVYKMGSTAVLSVAGTNNFFAGKSAGASISTGNNNAFFGNNAGFTTSTGHNNVFFGTDAGRANTTGFYNTFLGRSAGYTNSTGRFNTFIGNNAGYSNTLSYSNVALGYNAGYSNTTGNENLYLGDNAGYSNSTGSGNIFIGVAAGYFETGSNKLYIDNYSTTAPLIYGDFAANTLTFNGNTTVTGNSSVSGNATITGDSNVNGKTRVAGWLYPQSGIYFNNSFEASGNSQGGNVLSFGDPGVSEDQIFYRDNTFYFADSPGGGDSAAPQLLVVDQYMSTKLWLDPYGTLWIAGALYQGSSRKSKENIEYLSLNEAVATLNALEPVKYNYLATKDELQVGFIAEDVPELVASNNRKGVNPMDITAVLTKVVQEQQKEIEELKKEVKAAKAHSSEMNDLRVQIEELRGLIRINTAGR